ncbi:MAG: SusD/RagB family nutrient-binding outer membrane lipoprotein [Prevotella sp.]|uniref:SusD/RagB family nutrient-binding outer membrane lipoprotein n=1 Tax=Prevotella sp. TaxID=59823 RepID=UPI002A33C7AA|nr:SusD/RagB family nutrient-binding outer membrane lipoprotein [Prevotella sp.]MDD7317839.1 SusD/RagB family nutrient-binding outer membrane lipoprotein [Prevotellaceae bacterium]MDY4020754.1 SusD/RagB family nutrient-binding outer membrane lipoprotein [Prevotella sp.]
MKKILLYSAASLLMFSSCALNINDDPNYATGGDVTPDLILPSAENYIANALGDQMFTYAGFFAQYFEQRPENNQYNNYAELHLDEGSNTFDRCYNNIYAGAFADIDDIMSKTNNPADVYVCKVLRMWGYQLLVDNMSDAPYAEALKGNSLTTPKWDDGKTIFEGVLKEVDDAEANIGAGSITMKDPIFKGKLSNWKGFANALRLRIYLRMIDAGIDAASYTEKVKAIVAENKFFDGDVKYDVFTNAEGQYNPWYGSIFELKAMNYVAAYPIVSYYKAMNDPRMSYGVLPNTKAGEYVGQLPGSKTRMKEWQGVAWKNADVSSINHEAMVAEPIYIMTRSELQFLIAEVQLRFNNNVAAASAAYKTAVRADFASRGMADKAEDFLSGVSVNIDNIDGNSEKLKLIYMQKWASFFMRNHMEAWSEIRRTDVPKLTSLSAKDIFDGKSGYVPGEMIDPAVNYIQNGGLAKRLPYPGVARRLNNNTPAEKKMDAPIFWDVK